VGSDAVTLTATVVVALATVVYATLTYFMLDATRQSAEGAKRAAEAAALSIRMANAQIVVNFDAEFVWQPPLMFLTITPRGANVDVLRVMGHFGKHDAKGARSTVDEELSFTPEGHTIAGDARMQYTWDSPSTHPEPDDTGHTACALITYRLTGGAPERQAWVGADMYLPSGWKPVPMPPSQTSHVI
jgi:hypothetical protein